MVMVSCQEVVPDGNLRIYSLPREIPHDAWELSARLLTTLDLEGMVDLFARWLVKDLRYNSLVYGHDEQGLVFSIGAPARHSLNYRLVLGGQVLGELSVTRDKRFSHDEIRRFEGQVCGLAYALHNALRYRRATECQDEYPLRRAVG